MDQKLPGKIVLITGGNSGIGLASAQLFQAHGASVVVVGRDQASLDETQKVLGDSALVIRADIGNVAAIDDVMKQVKVRYGKLDVVFANASIAQPAPFEMVSEAQFDATVGIDLRGTFFTLQKALPLMAQGGSMIVTTSITNQMGSPNFSVYAACKAAVRSLVQTLGLELIGRGIRVNAISPGPIATPMFNRFGLPDEMEAAIKQTIIDKSPIKRFGSPAEVAKVALFLASDDASYVTGDEIVVDGGMSLL